MGEAPIPTILDEPCLSRFDFSNMPLAPKPGTAKSPRRICFVTGTRAEFGLMHSTLSAIANQPSLQLQIIVTGMHLDRRRGYSIDSIREEGWKIDRVVPWRGGNSQTPSANARATGHAIADISAALDKLRSDIVLVVGDRVEAFAAASAAHISGRAVAHVHGGDRAAGQVDDALRHAISKLAHVHFPATLASQHRLLRMGEDRWRIVRAGAPGIDGIHEQAASREMIAKQFPQITPRRFALLVLHPACSDPAIEKKRATPIAKTLAESPVSQVVIVHPNNDPGSAGIAAAWNQLRSTNQMIVCRDLPRGNFLGLLRDATVLLGNSSSGIIEAASFGTPVIDIGPRQKGREHGGNVAHVEYDPSALRRELNRIWNGGSPLRFPRRNIYGGRGAGRSIAAHMARVPISERLLHKLIAY
jgi:UDP-N-acetylglucosamine 2-epimerase (non-hydrolysing)/GDP/UDP-N,N'-diacetylbacillosamine 2-epimerase (hydrolysing)